jgi:hypothetical protein
MFITFFYSEGFFYNYDREFIEECVTRPCRGRPLAGGLRALRHYR